MDAPRWSLENAPWSVQTPCDERWDDMVGDSAVRHCARCDKDVYNLSAHSVTAAAALRASPSRPCIRITQRTDGAIRVREGWWVAGRAAVLATAMAACSPGGGTPVEVVEPIAELSERASTEAVPPIPELEAPPELDHIADTLQGEPALPVHPALTGKPAIRHDPPPPVTPRPTPPDEMHVLGGVPPLGD